MYMNTHRLLVVLCLLVSVVAIACGPSDEELAAMVAAEVERQVALIPAAPQGDTGPEGPQGPQGVEGPQGLIGPQGPQGETGPQGPQGATGPQGREGPRGFIGLQGPKGETGASGAQGATGARGPAGAHAVIPNVLEVEQLVIRKEGASTFLRLTAGTETIVPRIEWVYADDGSVGGRIWALTEDGMSLRSGNNEFCIGWQTSGPC